MHNSYQNIRNREPKMSYLPAFQVPEIVSQHVATTARAAALQRRLYTQQSLARGDCSDDWRLSMLPLRFLLLFFLSSFLLFFPSTNTRTAVKSPLFIRFRRSNKVTWCCRTRSTCISIGLAPIIDACQQLDVRLPSPRAFLTYCRSCCQLTREEGNFTRAGLWTLNEHVLMFVVC